MSKMLSILLIFSFIFAQVDYDSLIQTNILDQRCATSCHVNGGAYQNNLDLSSYENLMAGNSTNGPVVVAGDHASSLLWQKVNSGAMPPSGSNLSSDEINLIASWIDEGALETPTDSITLFFSEYAEGSSNNKYLEIYNPTDQTIDLSEYAFPSVGNEPETLGEYEHWNEFEEGSSVPPGEVYVIAHPSADDYIEGFEDMTHFYLSNGDDGYCLVKGDSINYTILDCIGDWNGDPGDGWDVAGVANATKDHTLVRKSIVLTGNPDWAESAGTNADDSEWIVEPNETWDYLGFHIYGTGGENMDPIANAGSDQTVVFESEVTLDGSGSVDPDGSIASYSWEQVYGETVTLSSDSEAIVTFTAPATVDSLSFTLTVTDEEGATGSATIYVKTTGGLSTQVFFSEYAEGSSNNKYLEIYNGTDVEINLSQYALSNCTNGCDESWENPNEIEFETTIDPGEVWVVCHGSADQAILEECDQFFTYLSNGDDVFGLVDAATGIIIDIIGEIGDDPGSGWDVAGVTNATANHTLVRKSSVSQGNEGDWASSAGTNESDSEWIVYDQDTWDNLGSHSQNVNAPSVAITNVSPDFIADNTEIEIMSELIPVSGSITNATIYYGTDGSLLNQAEMWLDSGNSWMGIIDPQPGNTLLQFKVVAVDNSGNEGESNVQDQLVASTTPTEIQEIHANVVEDQIVTIQGIVTIGSGFLDDAATRAYIQDESGRGLNLFDYTFIEGINRGDELRLVGYVDQYFTTVEVTNFIFETLSTENNLPAAIVTTPTSANSPDYEGTLISFEGAVTANESVSNGAGTKLTIDDITYVQIWSTTGISTAQYQVGTEWSFIGVGSQYSTEYQLLIGYEEDIATLGITGPVAIPNEFSLYPVYPNPFNPRATIDFSLQFDGEIHLNVYDINGKIVDELKNANLLAGNHRMVWNASSLPSGLYFIRLQDGVNQEVQKVMLLK